MIPADPALPTMSSLLDPDIAAAMLARSFGQAMTPTARIRYLRYKPGTNLMVQYDVRTNGHRHIAIGMIAAGEALARRATKPANLALAEAVSNRAPAARALAYERDLDCLVQWYPLDISLPALGSSPRQLRSTLQAAGLDIGPSDDEPVLLAYKGRRRAVLRVGDHVVKIYRRPDEFAAAVVGQHAASASQAVATPILEAVVESALLSVQAFVPGATEPDALAVARDAGALIATLHRSSVQGLPTFDIHHQLRAATDSAELVGSIAPTLKPRLGPLLEGLTRGAPRTPDLVPSHADFNARQLIVHPAGLVLTDLDSFCLAPPALDIATYAAYLVRGAADDLRSARDTLDMLLDGYGHTPADLEWFLATMILRRAARPFRYFDKDWPAAVSQMVAAAETVWSHGG